MSCGPSKEMRELADSIDDLINGVDVWMHDNIGDKLNGIVDEIEGKVNGVLGKLEAAIPGILFPQSSKGIHSDLEEFMKLAMIWGHGGPLVIAQLEKLKRKYEEIDDIDIDNIASLIRQGAIDLENLCKMVENIKQSGTDLVITGTPSSAPEIDMKSVLRTGKLPKYKLPKYDVTTRMKKRKPGEDFLKAKISRFNFIRG